MELRQGALGVQVCHPGDHIATPLVRDAYGELEPASWSEPWRWPSGGLQECPRRVGIGVLVGRLHTIEDAYAYAKFARIVLGTNDIDFRGRPHCAEEAKSSPRPVTGQLDVTR